METQPTLISCPACGSTFYEGTSHTAAKCRDCLCATVAAMRTTISDNDRQLKTLFAEREEAQKQVKAAKKEAMVAADARILSRGMSEGELVAMTILGESLPPYGEHMPRYMLWPGADEDFASAKTAHRRVIAELKRRELL